MAAGFGKFITLEGGEGVGKSTLSQSLENWLISQRIAVHVTREPGGTPLADGVRRLFKSPPEGETMTAVTEALLISAARAQNVDNIVRPALLSGKWVICDRFIDSTRVYQGTLNGLKDRDIEWLINFSTGGLSPDLTFLLDCSVEDSQKRVSLPKSTQHNTSRDDAARYDHADEKVHNVLRRGFLELAGKYPNRFVVLDASLPPERVAELAIKEIEKRWL